MKFLNDQNFFLLKMTQNGPIRENKWFLAIFNFFSFTLVHQASRLGHFSKIFENEVLVDFLDFGSLDMLDNAYYGSTSCSKPLEKQKLPDWRAKSCKMRPILQKKSQNLDF